MLLKILKQNISISQAITTTISLLIGFCIILLSIQIFFDVKPLFADKEDSLWGEDYLIISKKVSFLNTISNNTASFTNNELETIKQQDFVEGIAKFIPSQFSVRLYSNISDKFPEFYTDLFFEAIPDNYIDIKLNQWKWRENDSFVPIVIPKYYLSLYNFGFAISQGLPQVSEATIKTIPLRVVIEGNKQKTSLKSRVVGFSDRINTILVPQSFLKWANNKYGNKTTEKFSRIIIKVKSSYQPEIIEFFEKNNYDLNKEKLKTAKASYFFKVISTIIIAIGLLVTALGLGIMLLSFNIILQKNKEKITTLFLIGYSLNKIAIPYQLLSTIVSTFVFLLSVLSIHFLRDFYTSKLEMLHNTDYSTGTGNTLLFGFVLLLCILTINFLWTRSKIKSIIKKG